MAEATNGYWYVVCHCGGNPGCPDEDLTYLVGPFTDRRDAEGLIPYCQENCRPLDDEAAYWAVFEVRFVEGPRHRMPEPVFKDLSHRLTHPRDRGMSC